MLLLLAGCFGPTSPFLVDAPSGCSDDDAALMVEAIPKASHDTRQILFANGLREICGKALSPDLLAWVDKWAGKGGSVEASAAAARACEVSWGDPTQDVYDTCKLEALGLLTHPEMAATSGPEVATLASHTYAALVARGLEEQHARGLGRMIAGLGDPRLVMRPRAYGSVASGLGAVKLAGSSSTRAPRFGCVPVVPVPGDVPDLQTCKTLPDHGHPDLVFRGDVFVGIDADAAWSDVTRTLKHVGQQGYSNFHLLVGSEGRPSQQWDPIAVVTVTLPGAAPPKKKVPKKAATNRLLSKMMGSRILGSADAPPGADLRLVVHGATVTIRTRDETSKVPLADVGGFVSEVKDRYPDEEVVRVSADPTVPWSRVLQAIDGARTNTIQKVSDRPRELFPHVVVD